ncbi:trypsin-like cysteine/serine peptidase domain-containing protein [Ilyonectria robusta]|uniref:trypsin-like cysteine/serine peptidase domain-containing protein n=1 Tax=Ilyonectria robusta TaxID=1079257 RepID=UPI001E8EA76F|nr:trypsin-like cysteine/serine peptidase domain-containing protein [Ilyonectria robusta]KAH8652852.1 trypsin-like cysteine/serine peptidase domain-containing protein [Ilyonectria robusta]
MRQNCGCTGCFAAACLSNAFLANPHKAKEFLQNIVLQGDPAQENSPASVLASIAGAYLDKEELGEEGLEGENPLQRLAGLLAELLLCKHGVAANDSTRDGVRDPSTSRDVHVINRDEMFSPLNGAVLFKLCVDFSEAILNKNPMTPVAEQEIKDGRVPSGVVKILVKYPGRHYSVGTGILIKDRVVATVGHLLVGEGGPAIEVIVLAGVGGPAGCIERRDGHYFAAHQAWYDEGTAPNDLAFILLYQQFDTVHPLDYKTTPATDNTYAVIYGYPGKFPKHAQGSRLVQSQSTIRFDPTQPWRMVEHEADTMKGHSGSPVIDTSDGKVVGIHSRWTYKNEDKKELILIYIGKQPEAYANMRGVGVTKFVVKKEAQDVMVKVVGLAKEVKWLRLQW